MTKHLKRQPSDTQLWHTANRDLIARSLSEFVYEGELEAIPVYDNVYQLNLGNHLYSFEAQLTLWDLLQIDKATLRRNDEVIVDALEFCLDLKNALEIDDIVFGNWLEDVQNTLSNDFERLKHLREVDAESLLECAETKLQGLLDAHPKIIANRGRMGWGAKDNALFSPESLQSFQLVYLAANKKLLTRGHHQDINNEALLLSMMSDKEYRQLRQQLKQQLDLHNIEDEYAIIPCHPWQYQHYIQTQFSWALHSKVLLNLGVHGDHYQAQQSIRTLSNISRPEQYDIKLAISILNTSCYRGVPEKFIAAGHKISSWLTNLTQQDELLNTYQLRILEEQAGYYFSHPYQNSVSGSPYRYHEMLGCIWRQSAHAKLESDSEQHMLLSALLQRDLNGDALIKQLVKQSGLSTRQWLQQLFSIMSIPLYHLLVKYGVGVIAHGQNVVVYFNNSIPEAIAIKDFHGDLRLLDKSLPEQSGLAPDAENLLSKLPSEHLVHDLLTGHFISVYRFLSPLLQEQLGFSEQQFYQLLAQALTRYQSNHPQYAERFQWFDLFRPEVERVCLNKVRFKIGYEDNAERPLPELASPLKNPIYQGLIKYQEAHASDSDHHTDDATSSQYGQTQKQPTKQAINRNGDLASSTNLSQENQL